MCGKMLAKTAPGTLLGCWNVLQSRLGKGCTGLQLELLASIRAFSATYWSKPVIPSARQVEAEGACPRPAWARECELKVQPRQVSEPFFSK